ncbi:hypothetical protein AKG12_07290 [Agrobacterium sp. SUL3]|nr:hypothetical protein AKG12_07290 [Agrobacterium sp. SUL3]
MLFVNLAEPGNAVAITVIFKLYSIAVGQTGCRLALTNGGLHAFPGTVPDLLDQFLAQGDAQAHLNVRYRCPPVDRP